MTDPKDFAPGAPGMDPYRVKTALQGIGTSFHHTSRVYFSLSRGIVSEVAYPDAASPCVHDLQWIVTDGKDFFSEEQRHTAHEVGPLEEGIPAYRITNTCLQGKYRIVKEVVTDPLRDTLLQKSLFTPHGETDYNLYVLWTPCIGGDTAFHNARVSSYKGMPILVAQKNNLTLVLACSHPWRRGSVGFSGFSDAWMDLAAHRRMTREYTWAEGGRVSLVTEIDLTSEREITLALGIGTSEREAASKAWAGLLEGFDAARDRYLAPWRNWQRALPSVVPAGGLFMKNSALVLRWLESKTFPGAILSEGGVRPRDVGSAFDAYMSLEAREDAQRLLAFLMEAEDPGGYWSQILRTDGTPASSSVALDQVARVILMVDACRRAFLLNPSKMGRYWPLVLKAAAYLVSTGPFSGMDRWEEPVTPSLYTLSASVAALLAAADMADERSQPGIATYCRKTADYLFEHIDAWTWFNGYYTSGGRPVPNLPPSTDVLALVRFGLRKADDPRILDTLKALDATLRVDTAYGPAWKRTPGEKGLRPLLLVERALYEISAGNREGATALLRTLSAFGRYGFFPERVEPEGDPFGSPFPHGRTHASYIQLGCLLADRKPPEMPRFTAERYLLKTAPVVPFDIWRPHRPGTVLARGKKLRIELPESALIHWSDDDWTNKQHTLTRDTYLGVHVAELSPRDSAEQLVFTFFWLTEGTWENRNYTIPIR